MPSLTRTFDERYIYENSGRGRTEDPGGRRLKISLTQRGLELYEHVMEMDSIYNVVPELPDEEYTKLTLFLQQIQQNAIRDIAGRRLWSNPIQ